MERLNCLRCQYRHEYNGDCTVTGESCTAVPAAHCRLLQKYEDTGLTPEECRDAKIIIKYAFAGGTSKVERIRELLKADREGRVVALPCKVGDTMIDRTFAENPILMKNIRLEIAYESRCGIIFQMGYGIFADLVEHGRIKPVSEEAEEALEAKSND